MCARITLPDGRQIVLVENFLEEFNLSMDIVDTEMFQGYDPLKSCLCSIPGLAQILGRVGYWHVSYNEIEDEYGMHDPISPRTMF